MLLFGEELLVVLETVHHFEELVKINFSVSVDVDFLDHFIPDYIVYVLQIGSDDLLEFAGGYLSALVLGNETAVYLIKEVECHQELVLLQEDAGVHGGSQELGVVDVPALVRVD